MSLLAARDDFGLLTQIVFVVLMVLAWFLRKAMERKGDPGPTARTPRTASASPPTPGTVELEGPVDLYFGTRPLVHPPRREATTAAPAAIAPPKAPTPRTPAEPEPAPPIPAAPRGTPTRLRKRRFRSVRRAALADGVLWREILGPPLALRPRQGPGGLY